MPNYPCKASVQWNGSQFPLPPLKGEVKLCSLRAEDGISSLSDFRGSKYRLFFEHCGRVKSTAGRPLTRCDVGSNIAIHPHTSKSLRASCVLCLACNALHLLPFFSTFYSPTCLGFFCDIFAERRQFHNGFFTWLAVDDLCQREIIYWTYSHYRLFWFSSFWRESQDDRSHSWCVYLAGNNFYIVTQNAITFL